MGGDRGGGGGGSVCGRSGRHGGGRGERGRRGGAGGGAALPLHACVSPAAPAGLCQPCPLLLPRPHFLNKAASHAELCVSLCLHLNPYCCRMSVCVVVYTGALSLQCCCRPYACVCMCCVLCASAAPPEPMPLQVCDGVLCAST